MHLLIHGQKRHCDNIAAALQPSPLNGHQNETYDGAKLHQIGAICAPNKNDKNANRERGEYGPHFCVEGLTYLEGGITRECNETRSYRAIL